MRYDIVVPFIFLFISLNANADYYRSDPNRGMLTTHFAVPNSTQSEDCVIMKRFPGVQYANSDLSAERKLCALDVYSDPRVAICPKVNSSNPAMIFTEVPPGTTKQEMESQGCLNAPTKHDLAKFKASVTCSYTPSILGYYHLSRILSGAGAVPASAIRTVNLDTLWAFIQTGIKAAKQANEPGAMIIDSWEKEWPRVLSAQYKFPLLYDQNKTHVYGALSSNLRGEAKYDEVDVHGGWDSRYDDFKKLRVYQDLSYDKPVMSFLSSDFARATQQILQYKDVSDMILMDYIMNQQDRVRGNIHYENVWLYLQNGQIQEEKLIGKPDAVDRDQRHRVSKMGGVLVKRMALRDNDCGIRFQNMARQSGLLEGIRHLSPQTYRRFLWFAGVFNAPEIQNFLAAEALFTSEDLQAVGKNISDAAAILRAGCAQGILHLDLDLKAQMGRRLSRLAAAPCELPAGYSPSTDD